MAVRPLVFHPDARLRQISAPVTAFDARLRSLINDMFETMYAAPGRGLAAVQIGVLSRVFVMDATWKDGAPTPLVFVNPRILEAAPDVEVREEGCLSIPDTPWRVARPRWVRMAWQDLDGAEQSGEFSGFASACVQHESDHLDGRLILDHEAAA